MKFLGVEIRESADGDSILILGETLEIILGWDPTPEEMVELLAAPPLPPTICPKCGCETALIVESCGEKMSHGVTSHGGQIIRYTETLFREWLVRRISYFYDSLKGVSKWDIVAGIVFEGVSNPRARASSAERFRCTRCIHTWPIDRSVCNVRRGT